MGGQSFSRDCGYNGRKWRPRAKMRSHFMVEKLPSERLGQGGNLISDRNAIPTFHLLLLCLPLSEPTQSPDAKEIRNISFLWQWILKKKKGCQGMDLRAKQIWSCLANNRHSTKDGLSIVIMPLRVQQFQNHPVHLRLNEVCDCVIVVMAPIMHAQNCILGGITQGFHFHLFFVTFTYLTELLCYSLKG